LKEKQGMISIPLCLTIFNSNIESPHRPQRRR